MCAPPRTLAAFKIAVAGTGATLAGFQPVCVHGQAHAAAGLSPFKASGFEDFMQTFALGLLFHQSGARYNQCLFDIAGDFAAQFFDNGLIDVCVSLANMGIRVIIAGLDMDFKGKPFGPIPGLMAVADHITKVHAICMRCGDVAQFSHRLSAADKLVLLGEKDEYEPLCRSCFTKATR